LRPSQDQHQFYTETKNETTSITKPHINSTTLKAHGCSFVQIEIALFLEIGVVKSENNYWSLLQAVKLV